LEEQNKDTLPKFDSFLEPCSDYHLMNPISWKGPFFM